MQVPLTISNNQEREFISACIKDDREFVRMKSHVKNTGRFLVTFKTLSDIFYFGISCGVDFLQKERKKQ